MTLGEAIKALQTPEKDYRLAKAEGDQAALVTGAAAWNEAIATLVNVAIDSKLPEVLSVQTTDGSITVCDAYGDPVGDPQSNGAPIIW